jgi:hypothetical protein
MYVNDLTPILLQHEAREKLTKCTICITIIIWQLNRFDAISHAITLSDLKLNLLCGFFLYFDYVYNRLIMHQQSSWSIVSSSTHYMIRYLDLYCCLRSIVGTQWMICWQCFWSLFGLLNVSLSHGVHSYWY